MANKQIASARSSRRSGPGIYTDRRGTPHVVCGLDHWFMRWDQTLGLVPCQNPASSSGSSLAWPRCLRVDRFCAPPDFRGVASR